MSLNIEFIGREFKLLFILCVKMKLFIKKFKNGGNWNLKCCTSIEDNTLICMLDSCFNIFTADLNITKTSILSLQNHLEIEYFNKLFQST